MQNVSHVVPRSQLANHEARFIIQRRRKNGWRNIPALSYTNLDSALRCLERSKHKNKLRVSILGVPR